jgi:phage N-6-adenine-methyltransferase
MIETILSIGLIPMSRITNSSETHNWMTPFELFDKLNSEMDFELDPCAETDNLGIEYIDKEKDGLMSSWKGKTCFVNPPYGRQQTKWIEKALREKDSLCVFLIPARVDTRLWQDIIFKHANRICFIKGRIKFVNPKTRKKDNPSTFPSALVLFNAGYFEKKKFVRACKDLGVIL